MPIDNTDSLYAAGYRYILYDPDGTRHCFVQKTEGGVTKIIHEFDETQVLVKNSNNTYEISDSQGNIKFYGTAGFLTKIQDSNGNAQIITWSNDRITQVSDPVGRVAAFGYDSNDRLTSITDPAGQSTAYAYNSEGQLTSITYPDGLNASYKYNADGLRTQKTVNNVTTDLTWINDLLIRQNDGTDALNFFYDAYGTALGFTHNDEAYFYLYNLQKDVVGITDGEGRLLSSYDYDAYGNAESHFYTYLSDGTVLLDGETVYKTPKSRDLETKLIRSKLTQLNDLALDQNTIDSLV